MSTTNTQSAPSQASHPTAPRPKSHRFIKVVKSILQSIVLVLSVALIAWISYDTFKGIPFLSNHKYMTFQLWVCIVFLADFFIELSFAADKKRFVMERWFFFVISIPYLNIINQFDIVIPHDMIYYLRFVPLIRGGYSLAMVMGFISKNRAVSLMVQYVAILAAAVYILGLIFYYQEFGVNPNVKSFWDALYWSAMNMTTVGCYFAAVTPAGKVISVILPILGMLMLPLFTVYITDLVRKHNAKQSFF